MIKFLLLVLLFSAVAHAETVPPILRDKIAIENGMCEMKGDQMAFGGKETPCVVFVDRAGVVYFGIITYGAFSHVFRLDNGDKLTLVYKRGVQI